LHAVTEVDHRYPEGDAGGCLQDIPDPTSSSVGNLHAVWDAVIYEYADWATLPMDADGWTWYSA